MAILLAIAAMEHGAIAAVEAAITIEVLLSANERVVRMATAI
ncbi:MAG: hypothetical protein ABI330_07855 [Caldimonas sp.]